MGEKLKLNGKIADLLERESKLYPKREKGVWVTRL